MCLKEYKQHIIRYIKWHIGAFFGIVQKGTYHKNIIEKTVINCSKTPILHTLLKCVPN